MQARVQRQLGPGQKQREGVVIGRQLGVGAGRDAQPGSVGRHHAQPVPARRIDPRLGQRQQMPAGQPDQLGRKSLPRLAERLRADLPTADRHALQLAKQGIEFGLHAGAHPGHHHRRDPRQGQMAITGKSAWAQAHLVDQGGIEEEPGKLIQQRLGIECLSSYCLFINDLMVWILPGVAAVHKGSGVKFEALQFTGRFDAEYRDAGKVMSIHVESGIHDDGAPCVIVNPDAFSGIKTVVASGPS